MRFSEHLLLVCGDSALQRQKKIKKMSSSFLFFFLTKRNLRRKEIYANNMNADQCQLCPHHHHYHANSAFVPPRWLPLLLLANKSQRMLLTPFPIGLASDCRYRHNMVRSLEINVKEYIYKYIYKKDCFYLLYGKPKRVASALTACTQGIFFRGYFRSNLTSF